MRLAETFSPLLDMVFPPRCPLCGEGLSAQVGLCAACWNDLAIPSEPCCSLCQRPFPDGMTDGAICAPCMAEAPRHDGVFAATLYNDASRTLVLALKHGHRISLAPLLGRMVANKVDELGPDWLVIPVPLHRWRLWRRGFNQAVLLAREIVRRKGGILIPDALIRRKNTPSLGGLGRRARARTLSGAITVNRRQATRLEGANILLVDDVLTSGATSNSCVSALKRAGAAKVRIACFARVMDDALPHSGKA